MNNKKELSLEEIQKIFDEKVKNLSEKLGRGYSKKEYTFNINEKRRMAQMEAIILFSLQAKKDILYASVLARLGIVPTENTEIIYDINLGKFTVFNPVVKES